MTPRQNRRDFLGATAASVALPALAASAAPAQRPRVAALASTYHYLSHAYHIVGRFLDGFTIYGEGLHKPAFDVASLYIEQIGPTDLGRAKADEFNVRQSPDIADALTLGTGQLAVDAVLLIAEHGNYPLNDRLQKLYPRGKYFRQVLDAFRQSGRSVPVFIDKHLSYSRAEGLEMVAQARELNVPLMAGSSLPVTWRLPELEIPLGRPFADVLVASRGAIEIFGFHALETLQCMAERRDRKGKPQGVTAVACLTGDAVWAAADRGDWSWEMLSHALGRSHTLNPGDIKKNTRDYRSPNVADRDTMLHEPLAFLLEYADGLRATVLILNGHVDDTTVAVKLADTGSIASTLAYLPAPPGARFFDPLTLRIEEFFATGRPRYPVERTLLTGGALDAACQSRVEASRRIETPELAAIDYDPPEDSGFIRSPLTDPAPNRS